MPSSNTSLSNCYTPLPSTPSQSQSTNNLLTINPASRPSGSTSDKTRSSKSIRHLTINRHILSNSTGSSLIEIGHTKILCNVHGPRPLTNPNSKGDITSGSLTCQIRYAPFANHKLDHLNQVSNLDGYGYSNKQSKEMELSSKLQDAIFPSLPLDLIQKNVVEIYCLVLQDDGNILPAMVIAASLALADAGVEVYDLVSAFSVAVIPKGLVDMQETDTGGEESLCKSHAGYCLLADPNAREVLAAESGGGVLTIAMMKSWREVVFWDQTGSLPSEVLGEAGELCREGCVTMHRFMRRALVGDGVEEGDMDAIMQEQ
jgi:exosome complex component MTR3